MTVGENDIGALLGTVVQGPAVEITSDIVRREVEPDPEPPEAVDIRTLPPEKRPVVEHNQISAIWKDGKWNVEVKERQDAPMTMRHMNLLDIAIKQAVKKARHGRQIIHKMGQFKTEQQRKTEIDAAIAEAKAAGNYVG